jgi:E3 ubiquitin-protein ligase RNF14
MPHHILSPVLEDERRIELSTISAIFEELILHDGEPFSAFINLPVIPSTPLAVSFRPDSASPDVGRDMPSKRARDIYLLTIGTGLLTEVIQHLSNLPPLGLHITLPKGYPSKVPPVFKLSTTPQWLSKHSLKQLEAVGRQLWENFGHEQVVFAYINCLQQEAENAFGILDKDLALKVPLEHKAALLDFDKNAKRTAFEKETFNCRICLGKQTS